MKKFLRLLGIIALATSLTSTSGRTPKSRALFEDTNPCARTAPVFIVPPLANYSVHEGTRNVSLVLPFSSKLSQHRRELIEPVPAWLSELNRWRRMAGLGIITENTRLSFGSEQHARYLVIQAPEGNAAFRSYDRSLGPRAHIEDAHAAAFTEVGAEAAIGGPLAADMIQGADVAWEGRSAAGDIDELMVAPFHRLSLLAPWAQIAGYGSFGVFPRRAAALALRGPIDALRIRRLVEFPPAGSEILTNAMNGSEWPNPIAGCSGYEPPLGIPITFQTGRPLTLYSYGLRDLSTKQSVAICGFDVTRYTNSDAIQQRRARELLLAYGAIVLLPRKPLRFGHRYRVNANTSQGTFSWEFGVMRPTAVAAGRTPQSAVKQLAEMHE